MLITLIVFAFVQPVFAQKRPMRGTHYIVSKTSDDAQFRTIQAAVNAARPGEIIEILDEEIYEEQVTIDGTKNGITIRYIPTPNSTARPTIRWRDTQNRSTTDPNSSWEINGALRILNVQGVTIEGVIVDGGGLFPFGQQLTGWTLFHGNAAIAVVNSARVNIRDCELRNAYYGIYVKDRNVGGVFGNPNPHDDDDVIPLSRYGLAGAHLIEYNKIHNNAVGLYFESLWDMGSVVRNNLIYNNYHKEPVPNIPGTSDDKSAAAIAFKDNYLSPVAIYNNTFFNNATDLLGRWQVGYQHLIFNNIFTTPRRDQYNNVPDNLRIINMFPNRMKHNVFSATSIERSSRYVTECQDALSGIHGQNIPGITQVIVLNNTMPGSSSVVNCLPPIAHMTVTTNQFVNPGTVIVNSSEFPASGNNRWLQMDGYTSSPQFMLPSLFKSIDPGSSDFLVPDWDRQEVQDFIRDAGWPDIGIVNDNGKPADLGAIPEIGKRPCDGRGRMTRSRAGGVPSEVVRMNANRQIEASFYFEVRYSVDEPFRDPRIKYARWVAPIPYRIGTNGYNGDVVPTRSIHRINELEGAAVNEGSNRISFTLPSGADVNAEYGFIELVIEGTDGVGRAVSSDVIFLPFRRLVVSRMNIRVIGADGLPVTGLPVVTAGEPVTIEVTATIDGEPPPVSGTIRTEYRLVGVDGSEVRYAETDEQLTHDNWGAGVSVKRYNVYFTGAGDLLLYPSAVWSNGSLYVLLMGQLELRVLPQAVPEAPSPAEAESEQFTSTLNEPSAPIVIPPVMGNAYLDAQGFVHTLELVFNDSIGENWIHYMRFVFSPDVIRGTMYDIDCINYLRDPNVIRINMGCAFPGAVFTTDMVTSGTVAVNYTALQLVERDNLIVDEGSIIPAGRVISQLTSVLDQNRVIPKPPVVADSITVPLPAQLSAEFTAGPNPVSKQSGAINFFWQGKRIQSASLKIFDASGNVVNRKIPISDRRGEPLRSPVAFDQPRRQVGSWNLTDGKGRPVSEGTYLVRGVIITSDGKKERVSVMVGVR